MSDVLSGIGSLFGPSPNEQLQQMQQQFGMIKPGEKANQNLSTPLVLSPQNYQAMEQAKNPSAIQNFFQNYQEQSKALNALRPQQKPLQMQPMQTQVSMPQIQQQDLVSLLQSLGGGR